MLGLLPDACAPCIAILFRFVPAAVKEMIRLSTLFAAFFCHNVFHLSGADICVRQPCLSFFALDTACLHLPILVKRLKALAILFHLRQTIAHHPPEAPPLDLSALVRSAFTLRY